MPKARVPFADRERQYRIEQAGAHQRQDAPFGQPHVATVALKIVVEMADERAALERNGRTRQPPCGMPNSAATAARCAPNSGRAQRARDAPLRDDGIQGVRDALENAKVRVGPNIDEAEVALFSAQRRPLVAVTLERGNGAARVLDGVCLEQIG
ncbi:MAG: hypothetical protein ABSB70_05355 [Candidatus Velthaea sp.]